MSRLTSSTLRVGDAAPPLVLPTRDGELVDLSALLDLGAVLLVFVPGTWSPNTRRQLEALERAHDQFRAIGVLPVVVATQDQGRLRKALMHSSPSFLILSDETRDVARDYGVYRRFSLDGIGVTHPSLFLIDREARIRFIYVGQGDADVTEADTVLQLATWLVGVVPEEELEVPAAEIVVADETTGAIVTGESIGAEESEVEPSVDVDPESPKAADEVEPVATEQAPPEETSLEEAAIEGTDRLPTPSAESYESLPELAEADAELPDSAGNGQPQPESDQPSDASKPAAAPADAPQVGALDPDAPPADAPHADAAADAPAVGVGGAGPASDPRHL